MGYVSAALLSAYMLPRFGWRPLFACICRGHQAPAAPPFNSRFMNAAREGAWLASGSTVRLIRSPSLMFEIGSADAAGEMIGTSAGTST